MAPTIAAARWRCLPQSKSLPYPPAVDRAGMEERGRRHHAVALEHFAVLHDELHAFERVEILERIAGHRDQVGEESRLDRTAAVLCFAQLVTIHRHRAKRIGVCDAGVDPGLDEFQAQLATRLARYSVISVSGKRQRDLVLVGDLESGDG